MSKAKSRDQTQPNIWKDWDGWEDWSRRESTGENPLRSLDKPRRRRGFNMPVASSPDGIVPIEWSMACALLSRVHCKKLVKLTYPRIGGFPVFAELVYAARRVLPPQEVHHSIFSLGEKSSSGRWMPVDRGVFYTLRLIDSQLGAGACLGGSSIERLRSKREEAEVETAKLLEGMAKVEQGFEALGLSTDAAHSLTHDVSPEPPDGNCAHIARALGLEPQSAPPQFKGENPGAYFLRCRAKLAKLDPGAFVASVHARSDELLVHDKDRGSKSALAIRALYNAMPPVLRVPSRGWAANQVMAELLVWAGIYTTSQNVRTTIQRLAEN